MSNRVLLFWVVVITLLIGAYFLLTGQEDPAPTQSSSNHPSTNHYIEDTRDEHREIVLLERARLRALAEQRRLAEKRLAKRKARQIAASRAAERAAAVVLEPPIPVQQPSPEPEHTHPEPEHTHPPNEPAPESGSDDIWYELAECESGGDWGINTGNGYYGGLQFTLESWQAVGGSGYPHRASPGEQIARGQALQRVQGWGAWPSCADQLGLR